MHRGLALLFWPVFLTAQLPEQSPIEVAIQAYGKAHTEGRFSEAAAMRNEARSLLTRVPVDEPQFGSWARTVAQLYDGAGMSIEGRAVLEDAFSRTQTLGELHQTRIVLLNALADAWEQDRNLLKSLTYLEKIATAVAAAPPSKTSLPAGVGRVTRSFTRTGSMGVSFTAGSSNQDYRFIYLKLAEAYQQLGRPEAAAAIFAKMRALIKNDEPALAALYVEHGDFDEAASIYKKQAADAVALQRTDPLQSLANIYQLEERYDDAASALRQAIEVFSASDLPDARIQIIRLRQNLAPILMQAGDVQGADMLYKQLLTETRERSDEIRVLASYANLLTDTKRAPQAEALLNEYRTNHPKLQPGEERDIFYSLANAARTAGDQARAAEYEQAAAKAQEALMPGEPVPFMIERILQKAEAASNDNPDQAFALALQALDMAPSAPDRDMIGWTVPAIANMLAGKHAPNRAEQLYQHVFGIFESWAVDNREPLLSALENYSRFLMAQQDRWAEAPRAIQRYRLAVLAAHGPDTGWLEQPLQLTMEFESSHGSRDRAVRAGQDLLELQESLSGKTSQPYFHSVETLAALYEATDDPSRSLSLHRQAIAIADLAFPPRDEQRANARMNGALSLARQKQFEEAEQLANEAVAMERRIHPQADPFAGQLTEIKRMKAASLTPRPSAAPPARTN